MRWLCLLSFALLAGCLGPVAPADPPTETTLLPSTETESPPPGEPTALENESAGPDPSSSMANSSAQSSQDPAPAQAPSDVRLSGSSDLLLQGHHERLRFDAPAGARTGYVNAWLQGMDSPLMGPGKSCFQVRVTALDGSFESTRGKGDCNPALTLVPSATGDDGFRWGPKGIISWDARDLCECSYEILLMAGPQANTLVWDVVIDYAPPG